MKKRSLFLSVICSLVLVFVLVGFSIADVLGSNKKTPAPDNSTNVSDTGNTSDPSKPGNAYSNEGANKGSEEDPYYIYDAQTFVDLITEYGNKQKAVKKVAQRVVQVAKLDEEGNEVVDEEGNVVYEDKVDENGEKVYEDVLDENGNKVYEEVEGEFEANHFELVEDIDLSEVDYVPMNFSGVLTSKDGHKVSNVNIEVTTENLANFAYTAENSNLTKFHLGVFADVKGATISNIAFDNVSVTVSNDVYTLLKSGESEYTSQEITIGALAAVVEDSTISANVNANIHADAYAIYQESRSAGLNSMGGVAGAVINSTISNGTVNVTILADSNNRDYYLGGVAGYLENSTIDALKVNASISAISAADTYSKTNRLYIAGVAGYATSATLTNTTVSLNVAQVEEARLNLAGVKELEDAKYNNVAGIFATVRADDENNTTEITNVEVHSDVTMDAMFAGAIYNVLSNAYNGGVLADGANAKVFITITDTILDSNVDTLKAFGVGGQLLFTKIEYTEGFNYARYNIGNETVEYAVKLTGKTSMDTALVAYNEANAVTGKVTAEKGTLTFNYQDLHLLISSNVKGNLANGAAIRAKLYATVVD